MSSWVKFLVGSALVARRVLRSALSSNTATVTKTTKIAWLQHNRRSVVCLVPHIDNKNSMGVLGLRHLEVT